MYQGVQKKYLPSKAKSNSNLACREYCFDISSPLRLAELSELILVGAPPNSSERSDSLLIVWSDSLKYNELRGWKLKTIASPDPVK
jgi:hypothetical protein